MNELLFFAHIGVIIVATFVANRLGKGALIALSVLQIVLANLFVTKQVALFGMHVTATDAYSIGSLLSLNLYREMTSPKEAAKLANITLFMLLFFAAMAIFQTSYLPIASDTAHSHFAQILSTTPRIFLASIITYIFSQRLDLLIFGRLRKQFKLAPSMVISLTISQALDTLLFSYLALYGIVESVVSVVIFSYLIKLLSLLALSSTTLFIRQQKKMT